MTTFVGIVFGFFIGVSFPVLTTKVQAFSIFLLGIPCPLAIDDTMLLDLIMEL